MYDFTGLREEMIERQLKTRGITDGAVLKAMLVVPREQFVPAHIAEFAYRDAALPIAEEQTISQPYIVAAMAESLDLHPGDRVLEIGTGSGYAAAVLAHIAAEVYTVERHESLARNAERRFHDFGYDNIHVLHDDGTLGWPEHAPYDAIVVAAAGPDIPKALLEQLAIGGRLVIPTGSMQSLQKLVRVYRAGENDYRYEELEDVRFVPLIGQYGWKEDKRKSEER
jgi:protein-L-isoaspartate(D-aspartate) O-methyltransferase